MSECVRIRLNLALYVLLLLATWYFNDTSSAPTMTANGFTFEFYQLHFHWGSANNKGSEHNINGKAFPLEMHMVHFNQAYGTFSDAADQKDGLAVIGFLFKLGRPSDALSVRASNYVQYPM